MRKITYYIASTLDGFIAKPDGSVPGFQMEGAHADAYVAQLQAHKTILLGRNTYEAGYTYGLKSGQNPYAWARTIVCGSHLNFTPEDGLEICNRGSTDFVRSLKSAGGGDILLVGGGLLAGSFAKHGLLDTLLIKVNPIIYGEGIPLFGNSPIMVAAQHEHTDVHDNGVHTLRYALKA